jgi:prepilin-type N-terminal cleavage/methylation domain-containing protein
VSKHQRGFSLMELLTVVSIIGLIVAVAVPSFLNLRRRAALRAASAELRSQFHLTRSRAISRNVNCGMKFLLLGGEWHFAVYQDGDHDGVRNDDIKSGTDRLIAQPRVVLPASRAVTIGLLDVAIKDPDGDLLSPKSLRSPSISPRSVRFHLSANRRPARSTSPTAGSISTPCAYTAPPRRFASFVTCGPRESGWPGEPRLRWRRGARPRARPRRSE